MNDESVNSLVVFLSNPNRKAEQHVDTVMAMTRELAKYKHELSESRKERDRLGDMLNARSPRDTMGFEPSPYSRDFDPRQLTIPANARSVEVKF